MPMTASSAKDLLMRYTPVALALSLLVAVTSSVSFSAPPRPLDPRASALQAQGRAELAAGRVDAAIDAYEAALTVQPGTTAILLDLAEATRRQGMQGKALHYYRQALTAEPSNLLAISGEGAALAEKGALEKARRNLARLQGLCGSNCEATRELSAAIAKGPPPRMVSAEAVKPEPVVSEN
jgi:tetratricopeptide (TPR) repeat protein